MQLLYSPSPFPRVVAVEIRSLLWTSCYSRGEIPGGKGPSLNSRSTTSIELPLSGDNRRSGEGGDVCDVKTCP